MKRILLAIPDYSSLKIPIRTTLITMGYKVQLFDFYKPTFLSRILGTLGNKHILSKNWVQKVIFHMTQDTLFRIAQSSKKPDIFLTIKGNQISLQTVQNLRQAGIFTINWYSDWLEEKKWIVQNAPHYDLFAPSSLGVYEELKRSGLNNILYIPFAAQSDKQWNRIRPYDISFVGQHTKRRESFFSPLTSFDFHLWGYQKWKKSTLEHLVHKPLSPQCVLATYRKSKIVVNVFPGENTQPFPNQLNLRIFEALGTGAMLLTQDHPIIRKYFHINKEVVIFKTAKDLKKKAAYYLSHDKERNTIAQAGWKKVSKEHTFFSRLEKLLLYNKKTQPDKKIILVTPFNSTFKPGLQNAFNHLGFQTVVFDYRNVIGNLHINVIQTIFLILRSLSQTNPSSLKAWRFELLNHMLVTLSRQYKPEYVFVVKGEYITQQTIKEIKKLGSKVILWQVDPSFHPQIWSYVSKAGKEYDYYISCEPGSVIQKLRKKGFKNVSYMLGAADHMNMKFLYKTPKKYDIVLIGTFDPIREKYLKALDGLDVNIWGWGNWSHSSVSHMYKGSPVSQKELLTIYSQSKIIINVGRARGSTIPTNLRVFEAAQVGGFIMTDCKQSLHETFDVGKEIVCFSNPKELREKAEFYLRHPTIRNTIASKLFRHVKEKHTYKNRIQELFLKIKK